MKKVILFFSIMAFFFMFTSNATEAAEVEQRSWEVVQVTYEVQQDDTLEKIAKHYMQKNDYGKRELGEFISGIKELNEWLLTRDIQAGDKLRINYWKKAA
ncbi:MAG: LysM peptidoglycan-binding domain-containing protein [Selenomonas sp.]|uniref:LysM peptidoglycan-binding domain-containing protein n=1 Tax=Selenomonas sp. TaxID=2053611 RepID=UPI0025E5C509|nr:LysM peptidoglycan-binding domain-containing protein [Selenomonas sp.]MCR5758596.1 LysM peptidoglycan-binding domain-containing protein [Selenomonas sp.]